MKESTTEGGGVKKRYSTLPANIAEGFGKQSFKDKFQFHRALQGLIVKPCPFSHLRFQNPVTNVVALFILFSSFFILFSKQAIASVLVLPPNNLSLVAYYQMNEGAGTVTRDSSGNGNTGTLTNGPTWVDGKFGRSINFDGADDYINVPSFSQTITQGSFAFWVNLYAYASSNARLLSKAWGVDEVYLAANTGTIATVGTFVVGDDLQSTTQIPLDTWTYVVITADSSSSKIYINGVLSDTGGAAAFSLSSFTLGGQFTAGYEIMKGKLDDFRIYNRALSAIEISRMYQQGSKKRASLNTTGLVGYWRFNEGAGAVARDDSGKGNTGTLTNSPTWTTGKYGGALRFNGSSQYLSSPLVTTATTSVTLAAWFNTANSAAGRQIIVANGGTGVTENGYAISINNENTSDGAVRVLCGAVAWTTTGVTVSSNRWYHIALSISASGVKTAYLDGASIGTVSCSPLTPSGSTWIGHDVGGGYFNGLIDDVRIYNRVLSATEVANLYADTSASKITKINTSPVNSMTNGLVGYWTFDGPDISGTSATDRSGQGNTGTLTNGPIVTQGRRGQALKFDGNDDEVAVADAASLENTSYTIAGWMKPNVVNAEQELYMYDNQAPAFSGGIIFGINSSGYPFVNHQNGSNDATITAGSPVSAGNWIHLAAVHASGATTLYINGAASGGLQLQRAPSYSAGATSPTGAHIGRFNDGGFAAAGMNGSIDDVRIYSRALSSAEILQLYTMGK